eukprot:7443653-Pyramimonas_sp.AAC.1
MDGCVKSFCWVGCFCDSFGRGYRQISEHSFSLYGFRNILPHLILYMARLFGVRNILRVRPHDWAGRRGIGVPRGEEY